MPLTLTLTVSYSLSSVCVAPAFSLWSILNLLLSVLQTISNRIPVLAYRHKRLRFYKIPLPLAPQKERKLQYLIEKKTSSVSVSQIINERRQLQTGLFYTKDCTT